MKRTIISSMKRRMYKRHIRGHNETTHKVQSERVAEENALSCDCLGLPQNIYREREREESRTPPTPDQEVMKYTETEAALRNRQVSQEQSRMQTAQRENRWKSRTGLQELKTASDYGNIIAT